MFRCLEENYLGKEKLASIYDTDSLLDMPTISKKEIGGLVKTFLLYSRLPRKLWEEIRKAEETTEEGNKKFDELMQIFKEKHAGQPLGSDY